MTQKDCYINNSNSSIGFESETKESSSLNGETKNSWR